MKYIFTAILLTTPLVFAQTPPKEFPVDSVQLTEPAMQEAFAGKIYAVKLSNGTSWKWDFRSNGYFYFNTSDGFSDNGKWSVKETKLCTEGRRINASCNEIRKLGDVLNYKRDNGDVVTMTLQ